jgi:hypothetical protein
MKVDVRDKQVLESLQPLDVVTYLKARDWREQKVPGRPWAVFHSGDYEIGLPLRKDLRDFASRMADVLRTLELAEGRDQIALLADLSSSSADVIRVRVAAAETEDGTLRLSRAAEIVGGAKDMMLAAACAAVDPKIYYPSRKSQVATDFLRNVRMGQTERGSFVVTLVTRVPPRLIGDQEQSDLRIPEPFERRVTNTLASALSCVEQASYAALTTGNLEPFEDAVSHGVSANLCAALAGLTGADDQTRYVEIALSWAHSWPPQPPLAANFSVSRDWSIVLKEAARILKQKAPREQFELSGPVFRLMRGPDKAEGDVTVRGQVDEEPRSVWMRLSGSDYEKALAAHAEGRLISAIGELRNEHGRYALQNPRDVALITDDDDAD